LQREQSEHQVAIVGNGGHGVRAPRGGCRPDRDCQYSTIRPRVSGIHDNVPG
jgi:hypothetical protein